MSKKVKTMKVPIEFDDLVLDLAEQTQIQTGMPVNKTATMRRMATKFKGRIIAKGFDFDIILFGKRKKK